MTFGGPVVWPNCRWSDTGVMAKANYCAKFTFCTSVWDSTAKDSLVKKNTKKKNIQGKILCKSCNKYVLYSPPNYPNLFKTKHNSWPLKFFFKNQKNLTKSSDDTGKITGLVAGTGTDWGTEWHQKNLAWKNTNRLALVKRAKPRSWGKID